MATALIDILPTLEAEHPCFGCVVRQFSLCGILESGPLRDFRRTGSNTSVAAGSAIFFEGDESESVFTVTSGTVRLSKLLADGRRQIAGFLFPGDFLGLTLAEVHAFTAEAVTPVELCRFPRPRFETFLDEHPEMERRLFSLAAHELAAARQQVVLLGRKTATEKVVSFLLMLGSRCRKLGIAQPEIDLPMTRSDIADYLGLRIETVSRELSSLKASRLIRLTGMHSIQLLDEPRLRAIAEA